MNEKLLKAADPEVDNARRLGFIKVAIQHGYARTFAVINKSLSLILFSADLVPVFSFGENDVRIYDTDVDASA